MDISEKKQKKPKAIDLFCGCGGLTLGLKQAGFKVIGAVDNSNIACVIAYEATNVLTSTCSTVTIAPG